MDTYSNYSRQCKDTHGGIKKAFLLPFVEYDETQIKNTGLALTSFPTSKVYEFDVEGSFSQQTSGEGGLIAFDHTASIRMSKIYKFWDVNAFIRNFFRVIILDNNDNHILLGTMNGLEASIRNLSGDSKSGFNGFSVDLNGREELAGLYVPDFDSFFYTELAAGNVFNYDLNFDII